MADDSDGRVEHVHMRIPRRLLDQAERLRAKLDPLGPLTSRNVILLVMLTAGGDRLESEP